MPNILLIRDTLLIIRTKVREVVRIVVANAGRINTLQLNLHIRIREMLCLSKLYTVGSNQNTIKYESLHHK